MKQLFFALLIFACANSVYAGCTTYPQIAYRQGGLPYDATWTHPSDNSCKNFQKLKVIFNCNLVCTISVYIDDITSGTTNIYSGTFSGTYAPCPPTITISLQAGHQYHMWVDLPVDPPCSSDNPCNGHLYDIVLGYACP